MHVLGKRRKLFRSNNLFAGGDSCAVLQPRQAAGMAKGRKFRRNKMQGGQELLPGIPNQITIQNIAPKMTWAMQNVMQLVSREWRYALHSRSVYDARMLSKSTEAFLILVICQAWNKLMLILYSCKDGTYLQLPPVPPVADNLRMHDSECICIDGRVYLWVFRSNFERSSVSWMEIWMLDLAGDRRWTMCERGKYYSVMEKSTYSNDDDVWNMNFNIRTLDKFNIGALDGKIYKFRGNTDPIDVNGLEAHNTDVRKPEKVKYFRRKVKGLPQTEVYDPQSNILSAITQEPLRDVEVAHKANLECHFASFRDWEKEKLRTGPSAIVGCYQPFYSEWKVRLSMTLAGEVEFCPRNAMAPQVYHTTYFGMGNLFGTENLFFIREKLVKLVDLGLPMNLHRDESIHGERTANVDLQLYDTGKDAWKHWQSFPDPCGGCGGSDECGVIGGDGEDILSCVFADNVIWILVTVCPILSLKARPAKVALMRSLPFLGEEANAHSAAWIDTECSMADFVGRHDSSVLRPIYL